MGKKILGILRFVLISAAIGLILFLGAWYCILSPKEKARKEFIGRWDAAYQSGYTENQKFIPLVADLNHLIETSERPPQDFKTARTMVEASNKTFRHLRTCFDQIESHFDKVSLEHENDLLALTEEPLAYVKSLNEDLKQEIQNLKNTEPPK